MTHLHVHVLAPVQEETGEENRGDDEQSAGDDAHPRQRLVQAADGAVSAACSVDWIRRLLSAMT